MLICRKKRAHPPLFALCITSPQSLIQGGHESSVFFMIPGKWQEMNAECKEKMLYFSKKKGKCENGFAIRKTA